MGVTRWRITGAALSLLLALAPGFLSAAQAAAPGTPPSPLPGLNGALGDLAPRAVVAASITAEYDDNIARSDAAQALLRGLIRDDTTTTPRVMVDLASNLAGAHVFLRGTAGYDAHANNRQLDRQRTDLQSGVGVAIGRCSGALQGGYGVRQSDLADLYGPVVRNQLETRSVEADAGCDRGAGVTTRVAVSRTWTTNSAPLQAIADTDVTRVMPAVAYASPWLGQVSVYGRYDAIVYPNRVDLNRKTAGFDGLAAGTTLRHDLSARLSASLDASYVQLTPRQTSPTRFSGLNYGAAVTYAPTASSTLKLDLGRIVKPSERIDANFDVQDFARVSGTLRLDRRTDLALGLGQRRDSYANNNLAIISYLTTDTVSDVSATLNYRLRRDVTLSVDGRGERRAANLAAFSYSDWRAGLAAAVTY